MRLPRISSRAFTMATLAAIPAILPLGCGADESSGAPDAIDAGPGAPPGFDAGRSEDGVAPAPPDSGVETLPPSPLDASNLVDARTLPAPPSTWKEHWFEH